MGKRRKNKIPKPQKLQLNWSVEQLITASKMNEWVNKNLGRDNDSDRSQGVQK